MKTKTITVKPSFRARFKAFRARVHAARFEAAAQKAADEVERLDAVIARMTEIIEERKAPPKKAPPRYIRNKKATA